MSPSTGMHGSMFFCVANHGPNILDGAARRHLASAIDDEFLAANGVAAPDRVVNPLSRALKNVGDCGDVSAEDAVAHNGFDLGKVGGKIDLVDVNWESGKVLGQLGDLSAHVLAGNHAGVLFLDVLEDPHLFRNDEFFVQHRAKQTRGGVAHADGVNAGGNLRVSIQDGDVGAVVEQVAGKLRIIGEVGHHPVDASQLGGKRQRPLDPAADGGARTGFAAHDLLGNDAVVHAALGIKVGHAKFLEPRFV